MTAPHEDHQRFIEYQTLLILYMQQITPYVDTKDRHVTGLMHGLAAGLNGSGKKFRSAGNRWSHASAATIRR